MGGCGKELVVRRGGTVERRKADILLHVVLLRRLRMPHCECRLSSSLLATPSYPPTYLASHNTCGAVSHTTRFRIAPAMGLR